MQKEPSVSIIIANHNYGQYIGECIESVLAQSHKNIEIYISDNASTDMSWEVINSFDKKFPGNFPSPKIIEIRGLSSTIGLGFRRSQVITV